jgi:hypothetical protein
MFDKYLAENDNENIVVFWTVLRKVFRAYKT